MRRIAAAAALAVALALPARAEDGFRLVVHPSNAVDSLTRAHAAQLFLKKTTRWPSGGPVHPVEPADERLRERFADKVLGKTLGGVRAYWNQLIFSGRDVPPLERASDDEVVAYVRANPGAVGYVSAGAGTAGVKVVPLKD